MVIATMNGRNEKHSTRFELDPAILRLFGYHTTVNYLTKQEKYDYLVGQLTNEHGYIDSVALSELSYKDPTSAAKETDQALLARFVNFVDAVEKSYLGEEAIAMPAPSSSYKLPNKQK